MPDKNEITTRAAHRAARLSTNLQNFENMPDDARVALPVVCALFGRSTSSIWRDVKAKRIPQPIKGGPRCTRWLAGDLRAALAKEAA